MFFAFVGVLGIAAGARAENPVRGVKICVAADAPEAVRHAAEEILSAARANPLIAIMSDGGERIPTALTDSKALAAAKPADRAYDHLILVGLFSDPMIHLASQREARPIDGGFYIFGFGYLRGDLGYIESDRNPFLHSRFIPKAPYETEVVTITGSTPAGVTLAAHAFMKRGLVNGVLAGPGWTRPQTSLLDRDPLTPEFLPPPWIPDRIGQAVRIGISEAGEDEYRGVLESAGVAPAEIWRVKYDVGGAWDGAGAENAFANYSAGLHRRAYGNTLWSARFESAAQASEAAAKIAADAKLKKTDRGWAGAQPPFSSERESPGPLILAQKGQWVVMCTLPDASIAELAAMVH